MTLTVTVTKRYTIREDEVNVGALSLARACGTAALRSVIELQKVRRTRERSLLEDLDVSSCKCPMTPQIEYEALTIFFAQKVNVSLSILTCEPSIGLM